MNRKITLLCALLTVSFVAFSAPRGDRPGVIEVRLEKQMADSNPRVWRSMPLNDPSELTALLSPKASGLPAGWVCAALTENFPQLLYQGFRSGKVDETTCMRYFNA